MFRVPDVPSVIGDLHARGIRRIVCEGGPTLNVALFEAGLVTELFFTLAPRLTGGKHPLTILHGDAFASITLELRSLEQHENELYLRYTVGTNG